MLIFKCPVFLITYVDSFINHCLKGLKELIVGPVCAGLGRALPRVPAEGGYGGDHVSVSRTLCGALIFPSIANLVGRLMFRRITSNLQRTILVSRQGRDVSSSGWLSFRVVVVVVVVYYFHSHSVLVHSFINPFVWRWRTFIHDMINTFKFIQR